MSPLVISASSEDNIMRNNMRKNQFPIRTSQRLAFSAMVFFVFVCLWMTYVGLIKGTLAHLVLGLAVVIGWRILKIDRSPSRVMRRISR